MYTIENFPMNREQVARVCCVSEAQVKGWAQDRGRLFPEKEKGRGTPWSYNLKDAIKLAAVSALVDSGMNIGQACDAIRPYSPYGTLLNTGPEFVLAQNHEGRWVGAWGSDTPVRIVVNLLPIYYRIVAGIEELVTEDVDLGLSDEHKSQIISDWQTKTAKLIARREKQILKSVSPASDSESVELEVDQ